jgi:hypothetical protein
MCARDERVSSGEETRSEPGARRRRGGGHAGFAILSAWPAADPQRP